MTYQTLEIMHHGRVATIWLNRPAVRNAFNEISIAEITQAFRAMDKDRSVRVIVLAARGTAFCAGADLNWMKKMAGYSEEENLADAAALAEMMRVIYECSKPTIARVQGDCYAGGMGLVAACDMVVAQESAGFCLSEVRLGLIPATISPYVIRAISERASRRYFLTAERFDAQEARRIGLVHEVVTGDQLDHEVDKLVHSLLACSPHAVDEAKRLVRDVSGEAIEPALITETVRRIAQIRVSEEGREGVQAFLNKRKPSWLTDSVPDAQQNSPQDAQQDSPPKPPHVS
jgi:methylglutaconyl-CoA hydratase